MSRVRIAIVTALALCAVGGVTMPVQAAPVAPQIAAGTILANATPVANAVVSVYLQNTSDQLKLKRPLQHIATTKSDANGKYSLHADPTPQMRAAAAENDGWVNLVMMTRMIRNGKDSLSMYNFSRVLPGSVSNAPVRASATRYGVRENESSTIDLDASTVMTMTRPTTSKSSVDLQMACGMGYETTVATTTGNGPVNELHSWWGQENSVSYGETADSDIAVGFRGDGGGKLTFSGTDHVGNTLGITASATRTGKFGHTLRTYFAAYSVYGWCDGYEYYRYPHGKWNGNFAFGTADLSFRDGKCSEARRAYRFSFPRGTSISHSATRAHRWTAGFEAFGFGADVTSGFSKSVVKTYRFNAIAAENRYLCGNNDAPLLASRTYAGW